MVGSKRILGGQRCSVLAGRFRIALAVLFALSTLMGIHATSAKQVNQGGTIRVGVLVTLSGPFTPDGFDSIRGVRMALAEFHNHVAGKKISLVIEGTDASVNTAQQKVRKLMEQDGAQIEIGPLSGDEGLYGVKPYAKAHPNLTFLNGTSAADDTTVRSPAKNFFRFSTDGTQWMAGLGDYVYKTKHYHRVAVVAEDYSFPYSQVAGFMIPFCRDGGHVVQKNWVPIGTKDYSSVVSRIPRSIDAIFVTLGGADSINFLKQYDQFGGRAPLVGASVTVDQTVLSAKGALKQRVLGVPSAGPIADNNPAPTYRKWVQEYKRMFPTGFTSPSLFAHGYYIAMKAALLALQKVGGDLSHGQKRFQNALAHLRFQTPTGPVRLDQNHNAIANIYVTQVSQQANGALYNKLVKVVPNVSETLGLPRARYLSMGEFNRNNPSCP